MQVVHLEDRRGRTQGVPARARASSWTGPRSCSPRPRPRPGRRSPQPGRPPRARRAGRGPSTARGPRVASGSRIFVEGRHDAELVEKVWGDDLRVEGVVVEMLDGVDDLGRRSATSGRAPAGGWACSWTTSSRAPRSAGSWRPPARSPYAAHVRILGHPYVDVWQSVRPARLGLQAWPVIPRGQSWKHGICAAARLAARHPGRHRPGLEADPRHRAQLRRPRADPAGQRRGAHRLRHRARRLTLLAVRVARSARSARSGSPLSSPPL